MGLKKSWIASRYCGAALITLGAVVLHAAPGLAANQRLFVGLSGNAPPCDKDGDGNGLWAFGAGLDAANNQICNVGSQGSSQDTETYCSAGGATKMYVTVSSLKPDGTSITRAQSSTQAWGNAVTFFNFTNPSGTGCSLTGNAVGRNDY